MFSSNGNTNMGFSMCGAMGAWYADPTRPVICIIGDGGFCMNSQELNVMVQRGIGVKIFIVDNKVLGNTLSYQRVNGMKEVACRAPDYVPPDFGAISLAYGVPFFQIKEWRNVDRVVRNVLAADGPVVCDVLHEDFCAYEPRISQWDVGIEDAFPFLPRDEFRANMIVEPLPGWEKNV